jgi:hypothetical protein
MMRLTVIEEFLAQEAIEPRHVHIECCQLRCSPPESSVESTEQNQARNATAIEDGPRFLT